MTHHDEAPTKTDLSACNAQAEPTIRRAAILFAGGPAPAANAVISTAAASFLRGGIEVVGILNGYSNLVQFGPEHPMVADEHYLNLTSRTLRRTRNKQGILIGTARTNPGKLVSSPEHLGDPVRVAPLRTVYDALSSIGVDALVSIGGDDTLRTANKLKMFQDRFSEGESRIPVVHVPKTIDNDYWGIDFTFGYFTAVETLAQEIRSLLADAEANRAYFLTETMGRSAGWLAYGAAIAGEASLVLSVEDITGTLEGEDDLLVPVVDPETGKYRIDPETGTEAVEVVIDPETGQPKKRPVMREDEVVKKIVEVIRFRDEADGKPFGVVVLAEGLAELLPNKFLHGIPRDEYGHISVSAVDLGKKFAVWVAEEFTRQTGRKKKVTGLQLGYESRCAQPLAFDVLLGSQLGVGAYRALVEEKCDGRMVSVSGQLDLHYVPFETLVDPETLVTKVRHIERGSDFYRLARFLETNTFAGR
jgi:6-phosphofructokinase 1